MVLVLFETSAGFSLFNLIDNGKISNAADIRKGFEGSGKVSDMLKLKKFTDFKDISQALEVASGVVESGLSKSLKKFLKKEVKKSEQLMVADKNMGKDIKEKLGIQCVYDNRVIEIMRGIRQHLNELLGDAQKEDRLSKMSMGLSHSLSRYKLKFSPDKVDTMIVQAISLWDELDKELNVYAMRVKEWYGWHFPELAKIVTDNKVYAQIALTLGDRVNCGKPDILKDVVDSELEQEVLRKAQHSSGVEINDEDREHIKLLAKEVLDSYEYREHLLVYIKNRMRAIAPNLTHLVGELVGARLMAHAGSLMRLAKSPASTVQIIGAEKALFRALKSGSKTPKYGILFNASLVSKTAPEFKGKIARVLAAKCALACRVDALGELDHVTIGEECLDKVEQRIQSLDKIGTKSKFKSSGERGGQSSFNRSSKFEGKSRSNSNSKYQKSADYSGHKRKHSESKFSPNKRRKE